MESGIHSSFLRAHDGLRLHLSSWLAPAARGTVVMLHGLSEYAQRHACTAEALRGAGWNVAAPDLRGHGHSEGPRGGLGSDADLLLDLATVIDAVHPQAASGPLVLFGHSTGGAVAARLGAAVARPPEQEPWARALNGLVLSAPALEPLMSLLQKGLLSTMGRLIQDVPMPVAFKPEWLSSDPAVAAAFAADPLAHRQITARLARFLFEQGQISLARAARWTVPTLLLASPQDRLISPQACERFAQDLPPALGTLRWFPGLAHDLLHEPDNDAVHAAIIDWLNTRFPRPA